MATQSTADLPSPPEPPVLNPWTETVQGRERLRAMLTPEFWQDYRPFTRECLLLVKTSFVCCGAVGALIAGYRTKNRFQKDHRLAIYRGPIQYKAKMHVHMGIGAYMGGFRVGLDVAAAMSCAVIGHGAFYLYQNKTTFPNVLSGFVMWSIYYKLFKGYRKILAAAVVGTVRGVPLSLAYLAVCWATKEDERRRRARDEMRYQRYLEDVLSWRQEGMLMEDSVERRRYYNDYVVEPRSWHTEEQNAASLQQYRRLPPLDTQHDNAVWQDQRAIRNVRIKRQHVKETVSGGLWPAVEKKPTREDLL